jgi:hypothetical protein
LDFACSALMFALGPAFKDLARGDHRSERTSRGRCDATSLEIFTAQPARRLQIAFSLALLTAAALFVRGAAKPRRR